MVCLVPEITWTFSTCFFLVPISPSEECKHVSQEEGSCSPVRTKSPRLGLWRNPLQVLILLPGTHCSKPPGLSLFECRVGESDQMFFQKATALPPIPNFFSLMCYNLRVLSGRSVSWLAKWGYAGAEIRTTGFRFLPCSSFPLQLWKKYFASSNPRENERLCVMTCKDPSRSFPQWFHFSTYEREHILLVRTIVSEENYHPMTQVWIVFCL